MAAGKRRKSRELALQVLFQSEFGSELTMEDRLSYFVQSFPIEASTLTYSRELLSGIEKNRTQIDQQIQKLSQNWKLDRMSLVDRNILRIALYEITIGQGAPPKVAVNEAIEMAKQYSSEESFQFINGILNRAFAEFAGSSEGEGSGA